MKNRPRPRASTTPPAATSTRLKRLATSSAPADIHTIAAIVAEVLRVGVNLDGAPISERLPKPQGPTKLETVAPKLAEYYRWLGGQNPDKRAAEYRDLTREVLAQFGPGPYEIDGTVIEICHRDRGKNGGKQTYILTKG